MPGLELGLRADFAEHYLRVRGDAPPVARVDELQPAALAGPDAGMLGVAVPRLPADRAVDRRPWRDEIEMSEELPPRNVPYNSDAHADCASSSDLALAFFRKEPAKEQTWTDTVLPVYQLRVGDVARLPTGKEWEVRDRPRRKNDGRNVEAHVRRPGDPRVTTTISWPSDDLVHVRRPTRLPTP
jgi:hypothetical protein